MKKKILILLTAVLFALGIFLFPHSSLAATIITTCQELQNVKNNLSGSYELGNDIDCSDTKNWNGGAGFVAIGWFKGNFDGKGHKITGLYINRAASNYQGLFNTIDSAGVVKNVGLVDVSITGRMVVGGLVGQNKGTISDSYSRGTVSGTDYVGGLVGQNKGTISDSYSTGTVRGTTSDIGGLVGYNDTGTISNSYSTANVTGTVAGVFFVGGLVGYNTGTVLESYSIGTTQGDSGIGGLVGYNKGTISNSYSRGTVIGNVTPTAIDVGGLVGQNNNGTISNSYSTANVSGKDCVAGLVGAVVGGQVTNSYSAGAVSGTGWGVKGLVGTVVAGGTVSKSYWDTQTSGQATSAAGAGKTTAQMKQQATFTNWDFINIWNIRENITYPCHLWDPTCPGHNVWGYAWSENIGWFSFSCFNDKDGDGIRDENHCSGVNPDTGLDYINYGVGINPVSANAFLFDYAWSEHIGWVSFADFDGDGDIDANDKNIAASPCAPNCQAMFDFNTREFSGWARALSYGDGWDGWVKLRGTAQDGSPYGVILNTMPRPAEFERWAWGDNIVGWVSFNRSNTGAGVDYKVVTDLNFPPLAINLGVQETTGCGSGDDPDIFLNWTFEDFPGDTQSAYQIQIDNNSDFSSPEKDTGKVISDSDTYAPIGLSFGTQYWWRLKVWDDRGSASNWIYPVPASFTTSLRWPAPDFTWSPLSPVVAEDVVFDSTTNFCPGCSYAWDFGDGSSDNVKDPTYAFTAIGNYSVVLTSTSEVRSCPVSHSVSVGGALPLPTWREIAPF